MACMLNAVYDWQWPVPEGTEGSDAGLAKRLLYKPGMSMEEGRAAWKSGEDWLSKVTLTPDLEPSLQVCLFSVVLVY